MLRNLNLLASRTLLGSIPRSFSVLFVLLSIEYMPSAMAIPISLVRRQAQQCREATLVDILSFIFVNYVAHAMTVISLPGESALAGAVYRFVAFLFPFTGAWRGIRSIRAAAIFAPNKLQKAAQAGALCIVGRST